MSVVRNDETEARIVHVAGPRPTPHQLLRELRDVAAAVPLFGRLAAADIGGWGLTDAKVAA